MIHENLCRLLLSLIVFGSKKHRKMRALIVLVLFSVRATGFAAWLKCYVDLAVDEIIMNYDVLSPENAKVPAVGLLGRPSGHDEWMSEGFRFEGNDTFYFRLDVPDSLEDVQYVIETSEGAVFSPASMCQGRRAHASRHDAIVTLNVDGNMDEIWVWAGWATGHEAVSLTPKFLLKRTGENEL